MYNTMQSALLRPCSQSAAVFSSQLTFLSLLSERNHLIELSLYQPVSLSVIQPFTTRKSLFNSCEWAVHHHLSKKKKQDKLHEWIHSENSAVFIEA